MIDAVSTSQVQSTALRSIPQNTRVTPVESAPSNNSQFFISSRVRVDNLLDIAILEFRAAETGDVIRQYPSESQIRAFQRASELDARRESQQQVFDQPQQSGTSFETSQAISAPVPAVSSQAVAQPSAPAAEGVSVSISAPSGASYTPSPSPVTAPTQSVSV